MSTATNLVSPTDCVTHTQQWQHYASWNTSYADPAADCPALPPFLSSAAPREGNVTPPPSPLGVPKPDRPWELSSIMSITATTVQWFTTSKSPCKDHNCREPFQLWCYMPPFCSTWLSSSHPDRQHQHTSEVNCTHAPAVISYYSTCGFYSTFQPPCYDSSVKSSLTKCLCVLLCFSIISMRQHWPAPALHFLDKHMLTLAHACSMFSHLVESYFQTSEEDVFCFALPCPQPRSQLGGWCTSGTDIKNCLHAVNFVEILISCCSIRALWTDLQTVHLFVLIVFLGTVTCL